MKRLLLLALTALLFISVPVQADDPVFTLTFSGRAVSGGEPMPRGTLIEAQAGQDWIGRTTVADDEGNWTMEIDAKLLRDGICEAVFYVDGKRAGRQETKCAVDLLLEIERAGHLEVETATSEASVTVDSSSKPTAESQSSIAEEHQADSSGDPAPGASSRASDEETEPSKSGSGQAVRPAAPRTGGGGLADSVDPSGWLSIVAVLAIGSMAAMSFTIVATRHRRRH
ncbi:MAG: hypothetical protein F4X58_13270 [Chloroflexi bacterium]|nr:hypothetical protein [Chloroflexota bacterium]